MRDQVVRRVGLAFAVAVSALLGAAIGCQSAPRIRLATTTSVENSGLLTAILPAFEQEYGVRVDVLPVGSGRALNLLARGDVTAGLTHDPQAEAAGLEAGTIGGYRKIMFNDFVIVGPPEDPASVAQASGIVGALHRIVAAEARFVSRGDASGTHSREQELWRLAGRRPSADALLETGQGMAATLRVSSERGAYTLTDRATYDQVQPRLRLVVLFEGGAELLNSYAVFWRAGLSGVERTQAEALVAWLADGRGRQLVSEFPSSARPVFHVWPVGSPSRHPDDRPHAR